MELARLENVVFVMKLVPCVFYNVFPFLNFCARLAIINFARGIWKRYQGIDYRAFYWLASLSNPNVREPPPCFGSKLTYKDLGGSVMTP